MVRARILVWVAALPLLLLLVESLGFLACVGIQRFDYQLWSPARDPLPWGELARRTGFLWQNQLPRRVWNPDPLLAFRLRPNGAFGSFADVVMPGLDPGRYLRVGPTGFVKNHSDPTVPEPLLSTERLVFVTGGSPVAGEDLLRNEDTIPSQLENLLREQCSREGGDPKKIHVVNAGAPSYNSSQELIYFTFDLSAHHPVVWVQLTGINELWHVGLLKGGRNAHENKYTHGFPDTDPPVRYNLFPATQKLLLVWWPMLLRTERIWMPKFWREPVPSPEQSTASRFVETLRKGDGVADAAGADHYVFLQPTAESDTQRALSPTEAEFRDAALARGTWWEHRSWAKAYYSELRPLFQAQKKPRWFDLVDSFPATEKQDVYVTPRHFSAHGASLLAARIARELWAGSRKRLCPRSP